MAGVVIVGIGPGIGTSVARRFGTYAINVLGAMTSASCLAPGPVAGGIASGLPAVGVC